MNNKLILPLFLALLGIPLLPAFMAGEQANEAQRQRRDCVRATPDSPLIEGKLRLGGSGYYLVAGERWHFLMLRCNPATDRRSCAGASATQRVLEQHVGAPVRGRLCQGAIAEVEVAGAWYPR